MRGSRSCFSTQTRTTPSVRSASASCPASSGSNDGKPNLSHLQLRFALGAAPKGRRDVPTPNTPLGHAQAASRGLDMRGSSRQGEAGTVSNASQTCVWDSGHARRTGDPATRRAVPAVTAWIPGGQSERAWITELGGSRPTVRRYTRPDLAPPRMPSPRTVTSGTAEGTDQYATRMPPEERRCRFGPILRTSPSSA